MDSSLGTSRYGPADRSDSGGGGRGGYNRGHGGASGRDRGGGGRGNRRHHPYGNNHGNRGGRRGPRPPGNRFISTQTNVDDEAPMRRQMAAMVARVGELTDPKPDDSISRQLAVSATTLENITDLAAVLCSEQSAPLFLSFKQGAESPMDAAGAFVSLLVNCAATLPLQTPAYVGLTLAVHQNAPAEFGGFAARCVDYAMAVISHSFDQIIQYGENSCVSPLQLLLRYIAMLGKASLVEAYNPDHIEDPTTIMGLFLILVKAAVKTADSNTSILLRSCVLNTLPCLMSYIPRNLLSIHIIVPFEDDWHYQSSFAPGIGAQALLLKKEQKEDVGIEGEDHDDDEEDDDEEDTSEQVCDTLQDLMRCVKAMLDDPDKSTRFSLFSFTPWRDDMTSVKIPLSFLTCKSIPAIFNDTEVSIARPYGWDGILLFGRLPIFGPPADDDDDDDDPDNDEDMDDKAPTNEHTKAYETDFNLLDRFLIADAVRSCLICHQSAVTDAGVTRGSAKDVAQQIWSVCYLLDTSTNGIMGVEYIIVETLLPLILQSFAPHFLLGPLYVSRVLLELVRAQPAVMPQAVAVGVANLFDTYLPSLVPSCRDNFSTWLAFHLTNTDYQWPKAYWDHWAKYVTDNRNSRGDFVMHALELMGENLSSISGMVSTCLPPGSVLSSKLLADDIPDNGLALANEVRERVWQMNEDPEGLQTFLLLVRTLLNAVEKHREQQRKQVLEASLVEASVDALDAEEVEQNGKEDVLVVTVDSILRYQGAIRACLQKDLQVELENDGSITETDHVAAGQAKLIETLVTNTRDYRVLREGCLRCCLDCNILDPKAVIGWLVSHDSAPCRRWWDLAIMTIRIGLDKAAEMGPTALGMMMLIDREGDVNVDQEGDAPEIGRLISYVKETAAPIVKYTSLQVCHKLRNGMDPKSLTPAEVDLVEGLKRFVVMSRELIFEALTTTGSKPISAKRAMQLIDSDCGLSGEGLASSCSNSGSANGVEALVATFEAL